MVESATVRNLRVVEYYSGIGGARAGLDKWSGRKKTVSTEVVASFDMNEVVNSVYRLNFGEKPIAKSIEHLSVADINRHKADLWLLSPPCQPFTKGGGRNGGGDHDPRCNSFAHLTDLLFSEGVTKKPEYLLVENVPAFGESSMLNQFVANLQKHGYNCVKIIASPTQLGIPYHRPRFYLLASAAADRPPKPALESCSEIIPLRVFLASRAVCLDAGNADLTLRVDKNVFFKHKDYRFDVVNEKSRHVACFTKGYGQNHRGSGSLYVEKALSDADPEQEQEAKPDEPEAKRMKRSIDTPRTWHGEQWVAGGDILAMNLCPRLFSTDELLALHGYPRGFVLPNTLSLKQKYRAIGNSLSCDVHAALFDLLLY
ncbi:cytosine-5-methyltransferase [Diplonema papillatum]|nr:cytosine-5-methyltransferase [Diplonema papillatum]